MWKLRYSPRATHGMDTLPRGPAALVTAAIQELTKNLTPPGYEIVAGAQNPYRISEQGYIIEDELLRQEQIIKILYIGL